MAARALPLRPIWSGLLVNTGAYALAWGLLLLVPGWARRTRRCARGRCAICGYDRAGLGRDAVCPECSSHPAFKP